MIGPTDENPEVVVNVEFLVHCTPVMVMVWPASPIVAVITPFDARAAPLQRNPEAATQLFCPGAPANTPILKRTTRTTDIISMAQL